MPRINLLKKKFLFMFLIYLGVVILLNREVLLQVLAHPESIIMAMGYNSPLRGAFKAIVDNTYVWNSFLSSQTFTYLFTYRWILANILFFLNPTQVAIIVRLASQLIAFLGAFVLTCDYLMRCSNSKLTGGKNIVLASFVGGLLYGINPSYFIGDYGWLDMQFAFATLPWILWCFNKAILDKEKKYLIICSFIMILNVDEHFLWVGFPLILLIYSIFTSLVNTIRKKRFYIYPILCFLFTILIYVILISPKLMVEVISVSPYSYALTKAGIDACWSQGYLVNMLRAMTHMDLKHIYNTLGVFSTLNSLMPLTLIIPVLAILSLMFYKRNWIILFYSLLLIVFTIPFFLGSPLKQLHYWLFFNTPAGPAFRTWRIPDAYIALSLSVMTAFSLCYIFEKLLVRKRHLVALVIISVIFVYLIYSWPLLTGNVNNRLTPVEIPDEYLKLYGFLSEQPGDFRVIYIPEFLHSYGRTTNLKPFWSSTWGIIQAFLIFSSPKPTLWPIGWWGHFYDFALSPFYYSLLRMKDIETLSQFLQWADIKYVVIHNDIPALRELINRLIYSLNASASFKLVFHKGFIYVFENQCPEGKIFVSTHMVLVDGGYRVLKKLFDAQKGFCLGYNYSFIFVDQGVPFKIIKKAEIILTDKPRRQLIRDLIFSKLAHEDPSFVIYPYKYTIEYNPNQKWSRASYLDPHQQVWHPYVNWRDYAWDFDYMRGLVFTVGSNDSLTIPFTIDRGGNYVIMLRLFNSDRGGKVNISIDNKSFTVRTLGDYNGFLWYKLKLYLDPGRHYIKIINMKGFNAISAIAIFSEKEYHKTFLDILRWITSKHVINLNINLIKNPSFEGSLEGWNINKVIEKSGKFIISLDNTTSFEGNFSLRVSTNHTKTRYGWSWIRSNWISVRGGEKYLLITHMKAENVNSSHIVIEAYNRANNKIFQLAQVPPAQYGSFGWRVYRHEILIPQNVTKIRIVLNAGWSNKDGSWAITWFDSIKLIPLKSKYLSKYLSNLLIKRSRSIIEIKSFEVNPTFWKVHVNTTNPFLLILSETYNPLWEAEVYKNNEFVERVKSIPVYGIINGFWINETGNLTITIRYIPQNWFELYLKISITLLVLCIFYLFWNWRKNRGDKWAVLMEKLIKFYYSCWSKHPRKS